MTLRHRTVAVAVLATATFALAGCTTSAAGKPDTGAGQSSTDSGNGKTSDGQSRLPHHGAPKVPKPVDISDFKQQPCSALTQRQLHTLGVKGRGEAETNTGSGNKCHWGSTADHGVAAHVTYIPNPGGLSDLYAINKTQPDKYTLFKPRPPVNGFPSVQVHVDPNELESGICGYFVGMNDRAAISILIQDPGGDPCDDAKQVALSITKTMKDGSR